MPTATNLSTTAIRARDFSRDSKDPSHNRWTVGKMRHLVDALAGSPVAIITDNQTGHAMIGVTLESTYHNGHEGIVLVRATTDDESWTTAYTLTQLGETIIPLRETSKAPNGSAKWRALRTYSDEAAAAIRIAKSHPDNARNQWGAWRGEPAAEGVIVRYTPHTGNKAFADQWGRPWTGRVVNGQVAPHAWAVGTFRDAKM